LERITEEEIATLTLGLVKIPSETGNEQAIQRFYADYLEKAGMELIVQPVDTFGRSNIIGKIPGSGKGKSLMLHGHLDTIPLAGAIQPYYNKAENRVYGRGACDCKGQCALATVAGRAIIDSGVKLNGDLYIVGAIGEETTRKPDGSMWKIGAQATVEKGFPVVDSVVVLEASPPLGIALTNHGSMSFKFTIAGADHESHSIVIPLSQNPLFWQGKVVNAIGELNEELSRREHSFGDPTTIQLSAVTFPPHSGVPMSCTVSGRVRINPRQTRESVIADFQVLADKIGKESPLEIDVNVEGYPLYWEVSPDEPVVRSFQKAFKEVRSGDIFLGGFPANADSR
jgi:acetylornithine deacetylase/succinyl-diaminopimelate desuccinylase-like protein